MTAWGVGPYDNDEALDFALIWKTQRPIEQERLIAHAARRNVDFYAPLRALAALLVDRFRVTGRFPTTMRPRLMVALDSIRRDDEWLSTWPRPDVVRDQITREIADLASIADESVTPVEDPRRRA